MNAQTEKLLIAGAAGAIECAVDLPESAPIGFALIAHPHPLHGGSLDNKVVQTLARAFLKLGYATVRPNFRGVGQSEGVHDDGRGELTDLAKVRTEMSTRFPGACVLAGFSFGGALASLLALQFPEARLALVGPSVKHGLAAQVRADTLVIHGETDDVVPLAAVMDWARPQHLPLVVAPGVGHFFHGQLGAVKSAVLRHFSWIEDV
jgi:uncharacterized protein